MDVDVVLVAARRAGPHDGRRAAGRRSAETGTDGLFAIVANFGTTNAGAVDELDAIADVCAELGLWLHIDAAYGGAALCAPSTAAARRGFERADSFGIDPHKWLFAPYDCAALVYRDPALASAAHAQHGTYLDMVSREEWNPSDFAFHLSRRARGLPLWFSLATYGTDAYTEAVETTLDVARALRPRGRPRATGSRCCSNPSCRSCCSGSTAGTTTGTRPGAAAGPGPAWPSSSPRGGTAQCCYRICLVNPADHRRDAVRRPRRHGRLLDPSVPPSECFVRGCPARQHSGGRKHSDQVARRAS